MLAAAVPAAAGPVKERGTFQTLPDGATMGFEIEGFTLWLSSTDDPTAGITANLGGVAHGRAPPPAPIAGTTVTTAGTEERSGLELQAAPQSSR